MFRPPYLAALALALIAQTVSAQTSQPVSLHFDVRYGLFRPAQVHLAITDDPQSYAASGLVRSSGLLGLLRPFHFDLRTEGARDGDTLRPQTYIGDMDTGWRQVQVDMQYINGVPQIRHIAPDEPHHPWSLTPDDMAGTVDLMTALYRVARPQPRDALCDWSLETFDGRRHARLALQPAREDPDGRRVTCEAAYIRVAGYSPADMADRLSYPFTLTYAETSTDAWQLMQAVAQTPYGRVRILRRE